MTPKKESENEMHKSTYNKMVDFKKKISLLEGKRKAMYTKFEKEKRRNKEREAQLGGEIVAAHQDYIKSLTTDEALLTNVPSFPNLNTKVLERLSPNSAVLSLDYKVANLKRKLNKLQYKRKEREVYLETLIQKLDKVNAIIGENEGVDDFTEETKERSLENEIHKTSLKMTEADMVKKKYNLILDMFKKETLSYSKQIGQMESFADGQQKEIEILEKDYEEALAYRDEVRTEQKEWEDFYTKETKLRHAKVVETKRLLKEKKDLFFNLENMISKGEDPVKKSDDLSSSTSARKSPSRWPSPSQVKDLTPTTQYYSNHDFEEAFTKMERSAGVSELSEVIERFRTQKQTQSSLENSQSNAETDVREMGVLKEDLERQYAEVRYLGQDDNVEMREKLDEIELLIEVNQNKKRSTMETIRYITRKQENIRQCFYGLVTILTGADMRSKPLHTMLDLCFKEVKKLTDKIGDRRLDLIMLDMEEHSWKVGTEEEEDIFKAEEEARKKRKEENENVEAVEDEEVPTRASLRRAADIMVNAKERGRGGIKRK